MAEFVYPGLMLGMMRSFTEHRWGERPDERPAVVESNWVFGLLFLWNNLHAVHHLYPTLPWWRVPQVWGQNSKRIQAHKRGFVVSGDGWSRRISRSSAQSRRQESGVLIRR